MKYIYIFLNLILTLIINTKSKTISYLPTLSTESNEICSHSHCASKEEEIFFTENKCSIRKLIKQGESELQNIYEYLLIKNNDNNGLECRFLNKNYSFWEQPSNQPPGSKCINSKNCSGGSKCINSICSGKGVNSTCQSHYDCLPMLMCYSNTCQKQIDEYNRNNNTLKCNDNDEYQCINNMGCNNGKCIKYFSLEDDEVIFSDNIYLCKSMFIFNNETHSLCKTAVLNRSNKTIPDNNFSFDYYKTNSSVCEYYIGNVNSNITVKLHSNCSLADGFFKYCPLDSTFKDKFIEGFFNHINQDSHTMNRFTTLDKLSFQILKFPLYANADGCLLNIEEEIFVKKISLSWVLLIFLSLLL